MNFFLECVSPRKLHKCIVEADAKSVWMYLHDVAAKSVVADCPICSLIPLGTLAEFRKKFQRGDTPWLVTEYSTSTATIADIDSRRFEVGWAPDGVSIVALLDNVPVAMILAGEPKGYAKAISKDGAWGHPWDEQKYAGSFGRGSKSKKKE